MEVNDVTIKKVASQCFRNVFRTSTAETGFYHIDLGKNSTPFEFRTFMTDLKKELSTLSASTFNKNLSYHWLVRFDQQVNTPFHIDNAGHQSFLLLGYEPTEIESELHLADYHKYANDSDDAENFAANFTPVFKGDEALLAPYVTKISAIKKDTYSIVIMNNSSPQVHQETLGVFHKAVIIKQDLSKSRIVNSMVLNMTTDDETVEDRYREEKFLNNTAISK
ncbi:hypothetical protein QSV08_11700 [Maribacter sp. BPC-D8]|uniref:hypothetical protein n=1 Tax=Maribacter sp. BPC-D8 TaxID=3053613 RepID=UPI002B47B8B1|nr:hypothetical protein [Maribacter sp. BPC-D8]WRI27888.1 hypothetical protein QSV08_11700 [Maribacter sp. BPC-D8]